MSPVGQPPSFTQMKQAFFASGQRGAEKTPGFLVKHHATITEEHKHLEAILRVDLDKSARETYEAFKLYCEEMLKLYEQTIRHDCKKPMRDYIIIVHACRIMLSSARFIVVQIIQLLEHAEYLSHTPHVVHMTELLMAIAPYLYVLGIVVPGLRLFVDAVNVVKHTLYPTETTNRPHELSFFTRLTSELYRARFSMINDSLAVIINTFSSFPEIFGLSPYVATGLIVAGLIFDLCFLLYAYSIAYEAYQDKKAQYDDEIVSSYAGIIPAMSQRQLLELELDYCGIQSRLNLSLLAGSVILCGFSLVITAPVAILAPIGGLCCLLGTSLYLGTGAYAHYEQQNFIFKYKQSLLQTTPASLTASKKATDDAWNNFVYPLVSHTCFPVIVMITFAVSSPAALLLLIAFAIMKMQLPEPEPLQPLTH